MVVVHQGEVMKEGQGCWAVCPHLSISVAAVSTLSTLHCSAAVGVAPAAVAASLAAAIASSQEVVAGLMLHLSSEHESPKRCPEEAPAPQLLAIVLAFCPNWKGAASMIPAGASISLAYSGSFHLIMSIAQLLGHRWAGAPSCCASFAGVAPSQVPSSPLSILPLSQLTARSW
jgi:hypothetical protein